MICVIDFLIYKTIEMPVARFKDSKNQKTENVRKKEYWLTKWNANFV